MKTSQLNSFTSAMIIALFGLISAASAQDTDYKMVLSADNLDAMVQGRLLTSPVKPEKQNIMN